MQLGKAAGYAQGFKIKGIDDGITIGIIGDGTSAEGDLHDAMNACQRLELADHVHGHGQRRCDFYQPG